jgi:hypothetical protein
MKRLRNVIAAGLMLGMTCGMSVNAESNKIRSWKTNHSMGCMLLRECKEDVEEVFSLLDISGQYPNTEEYTKHSPEFNSMLVTLNQIGVKVFLADEKYFPVGHRGVYHTVTNNFYLNRDHMGDPGVLMMLMRHEGWHAAQDCMAGTIDNSMIAIIKPEDEVPMLWRVLAERTYPKSAVPWEAEAQWAGRTDGMTQAALESCARGSMWSDYEPTPKTGEWLRRNGFIQ